MIHFRLRRSFRLAVDLLSLNSAIDSNRHSGRRFSRRNRALASLLLPSATFAELCLSWPQRLRQAYASSNAPLFNLRARRHLAFCGLLLALSLEICGCETEGVTSLALRPTLKNLSNPSPDDQPLSFYDPPEPETGFAATSLQFVDTLGDPKRVSGETRPILWDIPESVYFVYRGHRPNEPGPNQPPIATAFVLTVPDRGHSIRFLVTARHVVDPQWAHCSEQNPASIDLRLNRRSGGVGYETIPLRSGASRHFYTPLDADADIAVIPLDQSLIPAINDYKLIEVPFQLLLSNSEMPLIRIDQQVMTARPSGEPNGYPVFDGGVLATMPAEPVGVRCGLAQKPEPQARIEARMLHVWFIDAGVPQGVSGAPVYASIARAPGAAKTRVLLGIQSVAWPERGMGGITPSPALGDLVRSAMRDSKLDLDFDRSPNLIARTTPPLY